VVKQQLRKLRRDFKERMFVSQRHERPGATAILKWGSSFPCYTAGVAFCGIKGKNLLQANLMLPAIGQVILIHPSFFAAEVEVIESHLMRIVAETYATGLPHPVGLASNEELVQMLICQAKSNLKRVMKLGNGAVAAHEQATPDLGADLPYPDPQLIHLRRLLYAAQALSLYGKELVILDEHL
jgi:hypothetical protein